MKREDIIGALGGEYHDSVKYGQVTTMFTFTSSAATILELRFRYWSSNNGDVGAVLRNSSDLKEVARGECDFDLNEWRKLGEAVLNFTPAEVTQECKDRYSTRSKAEHASKRGMKDTTARYL